MEHFDLDKALQAELHTPAPGPAPELEQTVDGLLWLIHNGTLRADLVIRDAGMDQETRRAAEALAGGGSGVELQGST